MKRTLILNSNPEYDSMPLRSLFFASNIVANFKNFKRFFVPVVITLLVMRCHQEVTLLAPPLSIIPCHKSCELSSGFNLQLRARKSVQCRHRQ